MEFLDAARSGAISGLPNFGSSYKIGPEFQVNALCTVNRLLIENWRAISFQNPHSFESNYDSSPYFPVGNFPNLKIPNHTTDFTSLPPAMHLNHEANRSNSQNDLLDGLENRRFAHQMTYFVQVTFIDSVKFHFRFSDPCLAGNSDEETDQPAPTNDKLNPKNQSDNNKLLTTLLQQINNLHETNSKIIRNINDQKGNSCDDHAKKNPNQSKCTAIETVRISPIWISCAPIAVNAKAFTSFRVLLCRPWHANASSDLYHHLIIKPRAAATNSRN